MHAIIDAIGVLGIIMLAWGLYAWNPTAMFVILGVLFISFALLSAKGTIVVKNPYKQNKA